MNYHELITRNQLRENERVRSEFRKISPTLKLNMEVPDEQFYFILTVF